MKDSILFDYPKYLDKIFDKLNQNSIKSIIVGGYIRDKFLNLNSKDIDIELFGVSTYDELEKILQEFGEVNTVGKSFGVCKLSLKTLDLDFTLPRRDNKIAAGHCGFEIIIETTIDFKTASSRRDFTMNAIGYDLIEKKLLDPFNGQEDIKNKILRAVNIDTFSEDPLRVLRAVGFASRFNFRLDNSLFLLCKNMCEKNLLAELPKERIYTELEKILLKSNKPSSAFLLLKELNALVYFSPLNTLDNNDFLNVLDALDRMAKLKTKNKMLRLTNKQTGHSFNLSPKEAADFFCKKNARKEFINPFEKYLIKDTNKNFSPNSILSVDTPVELSKTIIEKTFPSFSFKMLSQSGLSFE